MQSYVLKIVLAVAGYTAKPIGKMLLHFLKEKTDKTETKIDDYVIEILEAIIDTDNYTIPNLLETTIKSLRNLAKRTENTLDDTAVDCIEIILVETKVISKGAK